MNDKLPILYLIFCIGIFCQEYTFSYYSKDKKESEKKAIAAAIESHFKALCKQRNLTYKKETYDALLHHQQWIIKSVRSTKESALFGLTSVVAVHVRIKTDMFRRLVKLNYTSKYAIKLHYKVHPLYSKSSNSLQKLRLPIPTWHCIEKIGEDEIAIYLPSADAEILEHIKEDLQEPKGIIYRFVASSKIGPGLSMETERSKYQALIRNTSELTVYKNELRQKGYVWLPSKEGSEEYLIWIDDPYQIGTKDFSVFAYDSFEQTINFKLHPQAQKSFAQMTSKYQNEKIAIILGGRVAHTPIIQTPITHGSGILSGFTKEQSQEIEKLSKSQWIDCTFELWTEVYCNDTQRDFFDGTYVKFLVRGNAKDHDKIVEEFCHGLTCKYDLQTSSSAFNPGYILRIESTDVEKCKSLFDKHESLQVIKILPLKLLYCR